MATDVSFPTDGEMDASIPGDGDTDEPVVVVVDSESLDEDEELCITTSPA